MDKDILAVISKENSGFSKGQRMISKYILENYDKAAFMTAGRLGKAVGVSESTVVRFASELGYDGYPGMRKALQEMIRNRLTSVQRIEAAKDMIDDRNILKAVLSDDIDKLQTTLEELDQDAFNAAVDAILGAKRVYISAMRTSKYLAEFFGFYLNMMMDNVHVVSEDGAAEVYEEMVRIDEGDVFVGLTFPRYSSRAIKAMRYAKENGARTVGITDSQASPYYGVADVCLFAKSEMVSFLDSLVAPLSLVNALIVAIGASRREALGETFRRLESVWSQYEVYEKIES
jgi:DNA-binding MurR/RpiR family transcriptional regulator